LPTVAHLSGGFGFVYMLHFASSTPKTGPWQEYKLGAEKYGKWFDPPLKVHDGEFNVPKDRALGLPIRKNCLRSRCHFIVSEETVRHKKTQRNTIEQEKRSKQRKALLSPLSLFPLFTILFVSFVFFVLSIDSANRSLVFVLAEQEFCFSAIPRSAMRVSKTSRPEPQVRPPTPMMPAHSEIASVA